MLSLVHLVPVALVACFCRGSGLGFGLVFGSGGFAGHRDGESLHEIVQFEVGSVLGGSEMTSLSCNFGGN